MSNYYGTYSQYLGAQRCCTLKSAGPIGPVGPVGPASIGPIGNTGPSGASYTGPTGRGCRGVTGPAGSGAYTAVATYGTDPSSNGNSAFYLEATGSNQFYSDTLQTLIPIPITLPIGNSKWAVNISIVEFGLQFSPSGPTLNPATDLSGNTFVVKFYTDPTLLTSPYPTFIFNGITSGSNTDSYILTSASNRIVGSYNDILDLTSLSNTTLYIQLNQAVFSGGSKIAINGFFQFAITMFSLT